MTLKTFLSAAVVPLAFSLLSFNATATNPVSATMPLISVQSFKQTDHQTQEATKMFPAPAAGMVQHILTLKKLDNEADYKLEIQIGQTQMVDCNKHGLNGELKEYSVQGWGYTYYRVDEVSEGPSTMMACFELAKKQAFVRIPGELLLNYDSRLAKVFYLPVGTELRFRTWKVDSTYQATQSDAK
jgi:ecotin